MASQQPMRTLKKYCFIGPHPFPVGVTLGIASQHLRPDFLCLQKD